MTDDKSRLERLLETLPNPFTADGLYLDPCEPINKCYSTREAAVDADRKRRLIRLEDE